MAPRQSKAITIFRLLCLGYYYMVSSCCERQVGELGPPRTTLSAQQHCCLRFICEILKCRGTVLIKKIMKALSCSLEDADFAGDEWESHA